MQSTARCARCGGGEFDFTDSPFFAGTIPGSFIHVGPGGIKDYIKPPYTFGPGKLPGPCLCCTACGYWEKTWSPTREGSPQLAGPHQAMGSAGHVPGNVV